MTSDNFEQRQRDAEAPGRDVPGNMHEDQADGVVDGIDEFASPGESAVSESQSELDAMRDRYLRLAAEYDNFRKRTERERAESRDRAQGQIVERLLEPLDDLQRVAQFSAEGTSVEALLEGVRMVERKMLRALEAAGLESLNARGQPFNPELHDALMTTATESPEEDDTVGEVFQPGYRFRGLLLRPARVQVRKHGG
jgi:molecular chaperone GrpE